MITDILFKHDNGDTVARLLRMVRDEEGDTYSLKCIAKEIPISNFKDNDDLNRSLLIDIYRNCEHIRYTYRDDEQIYDIIIREVNKIAVRNKRNVANIILISKDCKDSLQQIVMNIDSRFFTVIVTEWLEPTAVLCVYKGNGLYDKNHITDGIGSYYSDSDRSGYVMDSIEKFATCIHFKEL
jgi:hypothetical protein